MIIGDIAIDEYPELQKKVLGGCAFNMAWHLRRDHEVHLFSPLSTSEKSTLLVNMVESCGVHFIGPRLQGEIPGQEIRIRPDGEKIFSPFNHGVLKKFPFMADSLDFTDFDVLMGPVHKETLPFFEKFLNCRNNQQKLFPDFTTLREFNHSPASLTHLIENSEVLQFSPEERNPMLEKSIMSLPLDNSQTLLMTLGSEGGVYRNSKEQFSFSSPEVTNVIDTTGAGDAFFSTFCSEYMNGEDGKRCLRKAKEKAVEAIERVGSTTLIIN